MKVTPNGYVLLFCAAVITIITLAGAHSDDNKSQADRDMERLIPSLKGPDLFRAHCAPCHGADAKGRGPVAPALKEPLPDLTTIAARNGGIYPEERIRQMISGDDVIIAHGSRDMPIWGPIFHQIQNDRDYGLVRLQNVTEFLRTLQEK